MRRKQLAKRVAIAVLSAATVMTSVPATAVFAAETSVEASDTAVADKNQVTVTATVGGDEDVIDAIKTALVNFDATTDYDASAENKAKAGSSTGVTKLQEDLIGSSKPLSASTIGDTFTQMNDVKFTDADHYSFTLVGGTGTYSVSVAAAEALNEDVANALEEYFNTHEFDVPSDGFIRNTDVAKALADALAGDAKAQDDASKTLKTELTNVTFSGNGTALDTDNKGSISVTLSVSSKLGGNNIVKADGKTQQTGTFTYNFTANVKKSDKTKDEANKAALAAVNAKSYPDFHGNGSSTYTNAAGTSVTVNHNEALLKAKLAADLKEAGYTQTSVNGSATTNKKAKSDKDGEYKLLFNNEDFADVNLTYSSDQKASDTNASVEKVLKKGTKGAATTDNKIVTEHAKTETGKTVKLSDATTVVGTSVYTFGTSSVLSTKIQPKTQTTATKVADAAKVVEDTITDQLKADGVDANGVSVTVTPVNYADNATTANVTDGTNLGTAETPKAGFTFLVKTSIKNDFYGWSDGSNKDENKDTVSNYLIRVETNTLKDQATKTVSLADQTVNLTNNYYVTGSVKNAAGVETAQTGTKYTYIELTPTFTPEDANDKVTYKVVDKDGNLVVNNKEAGKVVYDDTFETVPTDIYKAGSTDAVKIGKRSLGLAVKGAGTYTVTVTAGDQTATATVTVRSNFKDVRTGTYYANAVSKAYAKGVTTGVTADKFGVGQSVTRAQFVT